jgi:ubiquitin-protein ligase E3 C
LRASRRNTVDFLYSGEGQADAEQRTVEAIPLVLSLYQITNPGDQQRLCLLARDLLQTKFACFASGAIELPRLEKLARIVVFALDR